MSPSSRIRNIVRLRQLLRRWREKASCKTSSNHAPSDVPTGHMAVCVGSSYKRYIVRTVYLNHPMFKKLLALAEEEYGFANTGPLVIPCDELVFEEVIRFLSQSDSARFANLDDFQRSCHVDFWPESRPLLGRPIW